MHYVLTPEGKKTLTALDSVLFSKDMTRPDNIDPIWKLYEGGTDTSNGYTMLGCIHAALYSIEHEIDDSEGADPLLSSEELRNNLSDAACTSEIVDILIFFGLVKDDDEKEELVHTLLGMETVKASECLHRRDLRKIKTV